MSFGRRAWMAAMVRCDRPERVEGSRQEMLPLARPAGRPTLGARSGQRTVATAATYPPLALLMRNDAH